MPEINFYGCNSLEVAGGGGEQLLRRNVKRFPGGLVFKAHRLLYHSTLGVRVIKKKKKVGANPGALGERARASAEVGLLPPPPTRLPGTPNLAPWGRFRG